ncbi:aldehyde dehydrogenase family protein [Streptomyces sp. NPDC021749]|uniref:aldehyde dehydrogenase family protein n=1 Tax=Streptomyces sp. NPDC021749 TaxID=3154905 RepID=UPI0033E26C81
MSLDTRTPLRVLNALVLSGSYAPTRRETLTDVAGRPVAELAMVPRLAVARTIEAMRRAAPPVPEDVREVIATAGLLFATAILEGETPDDYCHAVARTTGLPLSTPRFALGLFETGAAAIAEAAAGQRPHAVAAGYPWSDGASAAAPGAVWTRKGDVLAVLAPGNHPGPHLEWLTALALGYRVVVRPSRRDPYTPARLIHALRAAGLHPAQCALLPGGHEIGDALVGLADRAVVFGGDEVVSRYRGDETVFPQGPGRSKILVTEGVDGREHLEVIAASLLSGGGLGCVNATALLVEGDPRPLAQALAERLAGLPALPPEHPDAVLPVTPLSRAHALRDHLARRASQAEPLVGAGRTLGAADLVADLGDGSAALRPSVHLVTDPYDPVLGAEMPFPCVWVAPWTRRDGLGPLRHSLALMALTTDSGLLSSAIADPTIRNVFLGTRPTSTYVPGLPHDGHLAEFLMTATTVVP